MNIVICDALLHIFTIYWLSSIKQCYAIFNFEHEWLIYWEIIETHTYTKYKKIGKKQINKKKVHKKCSLDGIAIDIFLNDCNTKHLIIFYIW